MIRTSFIQLNTDGKNEIIDITAEVQGLVSQTGLDNGHVLIFVPGSTGALSTIEYEPGLVKDIPKFMEKIIPQKRLLLS